MANTSYARTHHHAATVNEHGVQAELIRNGLSLSRRQSGLQCDRQQMKTDEL